MIKENKKLRKRIAEIEKSESKEKYTENMDISFDKKISKILIVDDEDDMLHVLYSTLSEFNYNVITANNGKEVLNIIDEERPDLILLDVVMPEMSGKELAKKLTDKNPQMKVFYISGYTDDAIVHHGVLEEGIPFLQKPFTPNALSEKVREVLEKK